MLIQGTEDLRVQKTIGNINRTFCELLLERDYDQISVTDICARAKIQRKTFYTYYSSVDALLREKLDVMSRGYIQRIKKYSVPEQIAEINREFYIYSAEQGELYEKIICSAAYRSIGNDLLNDLVRKTWQDSPWFKRLSLYEQNILLTFVYSTGAGLYRQWVNDGKNIPLENMILLAEQLLEQGIHGFSKTLRKEYASSQRPQ
ncbi:MAG: TetR/AcrR family transcriptional regulator [Desulfovibrionaceae bacterium]|nr:TetR/AcrR family transcriptional regulator [Desulfovibrionaceae bacterium]MBR5734466.1 TetR/AcrR family transcriptional regulator [Desulfovibrionaceae bacterium]